MFAGRQAFFGLNNICGLQPSFLALIEFAVDCSNVVLQRAAVGVPVPGKRGVKGIGFDAGVLAGVVVNNDLMLSISACVASLPIARLICWTFWAVKNHVCSASGDIAESRLRFEVILR